MYTLYRIRIIVKGRIGMTSFGPGFAGVCILMMLTLTMVSIFLATFWSLGPYRLKRADKEQAELGIET